MPENLPPKAIKKIRKWHDADSNAMLKEICCAASYLLGQSTGEWKDFDTVQQPHPAQEALGVLCQVGLVEVLVQGQGWKAVVGGLRVDDNRALADAIYQKMPAWKGKGVVAQVKPILKVHLTTLGHVKKPQIEHDRGLLLRLIVSPSPDPDVKIIYDSVPLLDSSTAAGRIISDAGQPPDTSVGPEADPARAGRTKAPKHRRPVKPREELTAKQQYVWELRTEARLSFGQIAERLTKDYPRRSGKPYTRQAAQRLCERAEQVKQNRGRSIQPRLSLRSDA